MEALRESDSVAIPSSLPLWIFRGILYYLSFLGPVVLIYSARHWPVAVLLAAVIIAYAFSGLVFLSLLILVKRLLIGPVQPTGCTTLQSSSLHLLPQGYGREDRRATCVGTGARISDPWLVELGAKVLVGADAVISETANACFWDVWSLEKRPSLV